MQKINYSLAILLLFFSLTIVKINSTKNSNDFSVETNENYIGSGTANRDHFARENVDETPSAAEEIVTESLPEQPEQETLSSEATTAVANDPEEQIKQEESNLEEAVGTAESTTIAIVVEEQNPGVEGESFSATDSKSHEETSVPVPDSEPAVSPSDSLTNNEDNEKPAESNEANEETTVTQPIVTNPMVDVVQTNKPVEEAKPEDLKLEEKTVNEDSKEEANKKDEDFINKNQLYLIIGGVLLGALIIIAVVVLILVKKTNVFSKNTGNGSPQLKQKDKIYKEVPQNEDRI